MKAEENKEESSRKSTSIRKVNKKKPSHKDDLKKYNKNKRRIKYYDTIHGLEMVDFMFIFSNHIRYIFYLVVRKFGMFVNHVKCKKF